MMEILMAFLQLAAFLAALIVVVLCDAALFVGVLYGASLLIQRISTE
jgi:hypothetical protein